MIKDIIKFIKGDYKSDSKRLDEIINSNRYKESKYRILKFNNKYALLNGDLNMYVDLVSPSSLLWSQNDHDFKDCVGSIDEVLYAFDWVEPIIYEYKIKK